MFEPFFTTKEVGKGSGLGLSMVYGFVKQSNGHIKIYSEESHGTTVKLYLPAATGVPRTHGRRGSHYGERSRQQIHPDCRGRRAGPRIRRDAVSRFGYPTMAAGNAAEALALIDGPERFDLLFTDVIMPGGLNGRQLATEALKRRPELKVLYTSGYTENAIVHHGRLDAGVLLLPKPYLSSRSREMIRIALAFFAGGERLRRGWTALNSSPCFAFHARCRCSCGYSRAGAFQIIGLRRCANARFSPTTSS